MSQNTPEFIFIGIIVCFGIVGNALQRYENIAAYDFAVNIVESDYVCVIVVLQIFSVDCKQILIITKDEIDVTGLSSLGSYERI